MYPLVALRAGRSSSRCSLCCILALGCGVAPAGVISVGGACADVSGKDGCRGRGHVLLVGGMCVKRMAAYGGGRIMALKIICRASSGEAA